MCAKFLPCGVLTHAQIRVNRVGATPQPVLAGVDDAMAHSGDFRCLRVLELSARRRRQVNGVFTPLRVPLLSGRLASDLPVALAPPSLGSDGCLLALKCL